MTGTKITTKEVITINGEAQTRFNKVIKQYDNFIEKIINDNRTWRLITLGAVAIVILSIIGWFTALNMKKESLLIVEVNELGRAKFIGEMTGKAQYDQSMIKDYMVEALIIDYLNYTRNIILDAEIMGRNYVKAQKWCSRSMAEKTKNDIIDMEVGKYIGKIKRFVSVESILRLSNYSWQFDWFDIDQDMMGEELGKVRYRGVFTIIKEAPDEKMKYDNPLGVYIVDYSITRVNEVLR